MDDAWATVETLADDERSGASEIAQRAADALPNIPADELPDAIETLLRGHPEMGPLWRLASDVLESPDAVTGAKAFLSRLSNDANVVVVLAPIVPDRIITISYSSTVRDIVKMREPREVRCMSSAPGGEGMEMVGVLSAFTEATVIDDDEAIEKCPADAVVVGADAVTPSGLLNKIKTREIAESARDHGVPCFAVAGETKFVPAELPFAEPFQSVDLRLFSGIATPTGLLMPSEAMDHAASVRLHPALRMLIERFDEDPSEGEATS